MHVTGLVFLHGTPLDRSLGTAASHACVRMTNADAIDLARYLHAKAGPMIPLGLLDSLVADTARTRTLVFSRTVPVDIVYQLAEVRQDTLLLYPDVYRRVSRYAIDVEAQAARALLRAGRDTARLDWTRLRTLVREARRARIGMLVDSLLPPAPIR
jgi:murein L,D-transpeptidase YcbB/YkuD